MVPIPYDIEPEKLKVLLRSVNGILLPGGDASLWEYEATMSGMSEMTRLGQKILKAAIEMNKKNDKFPVWGTCLGYELITMAFSDEDKILDRFNSKNHSLNTNITN